MDELIISDHAILFQTSKHFGGLETYIYMELSHSQYYHFKMILHFTYKCAYPFSMYSMYILR